MMNSIKFLCITIIFENYVNGDNLTNCRKENIHFEKILGLRPSDNNYPILYRNDTYPVTIDCIKKCHEEKDCRSFVLHYDSNTCYWFKYTAEEVGEFDFMIDNTVAWFSKTCFSDKTCNSQLWSFERIPGATLVGNDTKVLPKKITRNDCQQNCLDSKNFECRSVKFRKEQNGYDPNSTVKGSCTLSNADRHLLPNSFRIARDAEEYIENQCIEDDSNDLMNTFCAYEQYVDVILQHIDIMYDKKTKAECENLCNDCKEFHCRGFSLLPSPPNFTCLLHSEDSKIYGPRLLEESKNSFYYEKARCLNISVTCTEESMTIMYLPETNFMGRMYMQGYSDQSGCYTKGQGYKPLNLELPLPSSQCGIIEAMASDNRRLLSASLIIQYNNLIQTQGDRLIKVGCIFGNDSKLVVGTGVTVGPDDSNNGSFLINSTTTSQAGGNPLVQMKLVDHYTKEEISDVEIGQELDLIIEAVSKGNFDISASHLIAMTENGAESIFLLDDRGCPADLNVFPALEKVNKDNETILIATFQAFKFSSSPAVRFSVIVHFCPKKCPEVDCGSQYRQKRAQIETLNGTKILSIDRSEFDNINSQFYRRPLEIMVTVRNQKLSPDRLAFGNNNNKVLVAGYNYETNEVCVDYSLLLGIVISWVLIQIIFAIACILIVRRYKKHYREEYMRQAYEEYNKNFDLGISNLDNRRVRWADSGDEMQ